MARLLNQYSNSYRLIASDGSTAAFWAISAASGTALGILPNGSGGAVEECKELVDIANTLMDELSILVQGMDAGLAPAFIVISAVGKAAAIAVAEAALSFTDPLLDPSIWQLGLTILCSAAGDLLGNVIPGESGGIGNVGLQWAKNAAASGAIGALPMCKPVGLCTPQAPSGS